VAVTVELPTVLVDASTLARYLGVERDWVYEHAAELGARRLGSGPRARLRFSIKEVDKLLSCVESRGSEQAPSGSAARPPRRRRRAGLGTETPLLPIRGRERES
jgi:hypothetical protein